MVSVLTCVCRILQYILLLCIYFLRKTQHTEQFVVFDMTSDILMLTVGCVMVLFNVSLTHGVLLITHQRQKVPPIARLLFPAFGLALVIPVAFMVWQIEWTYYAITCFDLIIALVLYYSLWKMLKVMARCTILDNFEGKKMAKYFVRAFGVSFLLSAALNFAKSFWWD